MLTVGIVLAVLCALGTGFVLGWASRTHYVRLGERAKELEEQARNQGRIQGMTGRPGITPPPNPFEGDPIERRIRG